MFYCLETKSVGESSITIIKISLMSFDLKLIGIILMVFDHCGLQC